MTSDVLLSRRTSSSVIICKVTREYFYENGFLEIGTPMMMKSTPEVQETTYPFKSSPRKPGTSPVAQSSKHLLVSGYDRYIQLHCFRTRTQSRQTA